MGKVVFPTQMTVRSKRYFFTQSFQNTNVLNCSCGENGEQSDPYLPAPSSITCLPSVSETPEGKASVTTPNVIRIGIMMVQEMSQKMKRNLDGSVNSTRVIMTRFSGIEAKNTDHACHLVARSSPTLCECPTPSIFMLPTT